MKMYRNAMNDSDLAGLLCLFGSTESVVTQWKRQGETITGNDRQGPAGVNGSR
jgi:hypothetical protein